MSGTVASWGLGSPRRLPARVAIGLVYMESQQAFGYHMWTQVNIAGQWVDIDAALNQTDCEPNHIALALMPLNDEGMIDSITALLPLIGRLNIEVLDVKK